MSVLREKLTLKSCGYRIMELMFTLLTNQQVGKSLAHKLGGNALCNVHISTFSMLGEPADFLTALFRFTVF